MSKKLQFYKKIKNFIFNLLCYIDGKRVFAFVGKSGTGKSFRAKMVANIYKVDAIIDDGILIVGDKIMAGHTAKSEKFYLQAVKVALFDDINHRKEVVNAIQNGGYKRILILGTSDKMISKIIDHLKLPKLHKTIRIEDISTPKEIEAALKSRLAGNHVICVPGIEVKRDSSNIFYDSFKIIFNNKNVRLPFFKKRGDMVEKSIVRPHFQDGKIDKPIVVSEVTLKKIIKNSINDFDNNFKTLKIKIANNRKGGYDVEISLKTPKNRVSSEVLTTLQQHILKNVEKSTSLVLGAVRISIDKWVK